MKGQHAGVTSSDAAPASDLLTIGSFGRLVGLTPSALRFYDDCGLLPPARVDGATGYRWYRADQTDRATQLRELRAVDLPLASVRVVLDGSGSDAEGVLRQHLDALQGKAERARRSIAGFLAEMSPHPPQRVQVRGAELASAVRQVTPAAARTDELPAITKVLLEACGGELRVVATDRYRLSVRVLTTCGSVSGDLRLLVPVPDLIDVAGWAARHDVVEIGVDGQQVTVPAGDEVRLLALDEQEYPDYQAILAALPTPTTQVIVDRLALLALMRAEGSPEVMAVSVGSDRVELTDVADGRRLGGLDAVTTGSDVVVGFAPGLLGAALETSVGPDVLLELSESARPVVVRSADQGTFTTLVMPHRFDGAARVRE